MVRIEEGAFNFCYLLVNTETGEDILFQCDFDYPSLAINFGWTPCPRCRETDGTIDCQHQTASEMIASAQDFLDEHIGEEVEDCGYFG